MSGVRRCDKLAATGERKAGSGRVTVLAKYQRLESEATWRPEPDAQRRDVIVSIGDATLTIAALNGSALSHWSLPAIVRLNPGQRPALFAPGDDLPESVEIAEGEMVDAIESVLNAIHRGPMRRGRMRSLIVAGVLLALLAGAAFWLPGAITRYTASLVPDAARAEIGQRLRAEVRRLTGAACSETAGLRALAKLEARLFPDGGTRLVVLPSALAETAHLPGGTILIGHKLVEDHESPDVLAGFLLAEDLRRTESDPLEHVLADAGLTASLRLLTTGRLDDDALRRHAEDLVASTNGGVDEKPLIDRLAAAGVSGAPYAYAVDFSGRSTLPIIEGSQDTVTLPPLLGDGDWIALQRICES